MVESSLEAIERLLTESLAACEDAECRFRVRTALQLLEAMAAELEEMQETVDVFETAIAADEPLRARLVDLEILDE